MASRQPLWFEATPALDDEIRERFGSTLEAAAAGERDDWQREPRSNLALVVLLDQFSRNLWRGSAQAFSQDAKALRLARAAVERGDLARLAPIEAAFLTLPFEHSESLEDQRACVRHLEAIAGSATPEWAAVIESLIPYAEQHAEVIRRFGRFPHRNRVLGRESTPEERAYLEGGAETYGQS